nr:rab11 family-interacting protein 5-like [Columba livia]
MACSNPKGDMGGGGGKAGTSDAYTIIQLGREKYSTSVAEKSPGNPEWREECAFELPPELGGLVLTVMHRALVGMDRFLGQAMVPLEPALQRGRAPDERAAWRMGGVGGAASEFVVSNSNQRRAQTSERASRSGCAGRDALFWHGTT